MASDIEISLAQKLDVYAVTDTTAGGSNYLSFAVAVGNAQVVALGECRSLLNDGLDALVSSSEANAEEDFFRRYLELGVTVLPAKPSGASSEPSASISPSPAS